MAIVESLIKQVPERIESADLSNDELLCVQLDTPDKHLDLFILPEDKKVTAWTSINQRGLSIPGSTTLLYAQAKINIQAAANLLGRPVHYELRTKHEKMKMWAEMKGGLVFEWDQTETVNNTFFARKTFFPNSISSD